MIRSIFDLSEYGSVYHNSNHLKVFQLILIKNTSVMDRGASSSSDSSGAALVPCKARYVPGLKGKNPRLLDPQGYVMLHIKTDGAKNFFKCAEYKDGCQVRVSLAWETDMIVRHNGLTHCHDNKLLEREVQEMDKEKVKEAANNMTVAPRSVHQKLSTEMLAKHGDQSALSLLPSSKSIQQKIYAARKGKNMFPPVPKSWDFEIPPEFKVTFDSLPFLIADIEIPGRDANRILGFSSPAGIALMESAEFLSGDGTFEVTKSTQFAQMWIIMTKLDKSAIPVAFYLLPSKEQIAYKLMFQSLLKVSSNILPNYWLLDYEKGTINALKEVFGNQAVVQGCLVHWKRCVFRKIQDLGLVEVINHDSSVAKWVRSFHVLQLVPIEDLDLDEEDMEAKARTKGYNAALDEFYHYFETTWIGPKTSTLGGQRRKPRYSPKI